MEFSREYIKELEYDFSKMPIEQLKLIAHLAKNEVERKEFRRRANELTYAKK